MAGLSPFVIEKCIQSIVGHPKTIKKLKSGDLLLEVDRPKQVENLLKTTKIFDLKVKISLHQCLNSSKGVIRCPELRPCSDKEIIDNLTDQGVTGVRNVSVRKNGVLKSTNTYVLTFNTPILPKKIKVAFLSVNLEVYIPNPLRCYQCQVFGHHEDYCMKKPICGNCGGGRPMMIATVKIQLNASTAMAITQFFLATVQHGRKKKRFSKSSMRNQ